MKSKIDNNFLTKFKFNFYVSATSCELITGDVDTECIRVIGGVVLFVNKDADVNDIKREVSQVLHIISENFSKGTYKTAYDGITDTIFVADELISYRHIYPDEKDEIYPTISEKSFPKRLSYILIASISVFLILATFLFCDDGEEKREEELKVKGDVSDKNIGEGDNERRSSEFFYFPNQAVVFDAEKKISERRKSESYERRVSFLNDLKNDVLDDTESGSIDEIKQSSNSLQINGDAKKISYNSSEPKPEHDQVRKKEEQNDMWTYQVTHNFI